MATPAVFLTYKKKKKSAAMMNKELTKPTFVSLFWNFLFYYKYGSIPISEDIFC